LNYSFLLLNDLNILKEADKIEHPFSIPSNKIA